MAARMCLRHTRIEDNGNGIDDDDDRGNHGEYDGDGHDASIGATFSKDDCERPEGVQSDTRAIA